MTKKYAFIKIDKYLHIHYYISKMCFECHMNLQDNTIMKQISIADENTFHLWNSTSISHLLIASSGFNGIDVRNVALKILSDYYKWYEKKTNQYAIPIEKLKQHITYVLNNTTEHRNKNNLITYLQNMN
tara:strand:- start:252 stop:638 length:387 start_codon:yes stop_codon:yes gene_type:complete